MNARTKGFQLDAQESLMPHNSRIQEDVQMYNRSSSNEKDLDQFGKLLTEIFVHARNHCILGSFFKILYACGIPFCESTYFLSFFDGQFLKCDILPVSNDPVFLGVQMYLRVVRSNR